MCVTIIQKKEISIHPLLGEHKFQCFILTWSSFMKCKRLVVGYGIDSVVSVRGSVTDGGLL